MICFNLKFDTRYCSYSFRILYVDVIDAWNSLCSETDVTLIRN